MNQKKLFFTSIFGRLIYCKNENWKNLFSIVFYFVINVAQT